MSHYTYSVAASLNYYEEAVIVSVGGIKLLASMTQRCIVTTVIKPAGPSYSESLSL